MKAAALLGVYRRLGFGIIGCGFKHVEGGGVYVTNDRRVWQRFIRWDLL